MNQQAPEDDPASIDVDELKAFYDDVYHANAGCGDDSHVDAHYERLFQRLAIKPGSRVLDVACGTGAWLRVCQAHGCEVAGVDLSERAIAACSATMPDGNFHAQPAEKLPFATDEFDVVTCLGSLEHFVDPKSGVEEMVRVARADATFLILVPNKDFLTRKLGLFAGTYQVDAREVVRSLEEWRALFASAGLEVRERWRDLHILNRRWITLGPAYLWPARLLQALLLAVWPLKWQYQVYHRCSAAAAR